MAKGKIKNIDLKSCEIKIDKDTYKIDKDAAKKLSDDIFAKNSEVEYEIIEKKNISIKKLRGEEFVVDKNEVKKLNTPKTVKLFSYPYNFVRVNEKVDREPVNNGELSGKIVCTLTNKSPIFFPGNEKENPKGHMNQEFLEKDGKYIIPASSLKGSFRSVLEAISNSCLVNIENERLEKRLKAGDLKDPIFGIIKRLPTENEDGLIVEAVKLKVKTSALPSNYFNFRNDPVEGIYNISLSNLVKNYEKIDTTDIFEKITSEKKDLEGVLWITSKIAKKTHEKILYPKPDGRLFKFTLNEYNDIKYLLEQRYKRDLKNNKEFYIENIKSGDSIIFQVDNNGNAKNLAFSEIPRLRYKYSPYDLIPKELKACDTFENACYACRIFGMTGNSEDKKEEDKDKMALQGRVFFKDATIEKPDIQREYVTIKSLGEPHPTLTRFYLEDGTYDDAAKIRGRKFYWHHIDKLDHLFNKASITATPDKNGKIKLPHNSSIKFMNPGNEFNFEVSFKNLKEDELGLLLLTLELENGMLHKFGKAKALGFGSSEVKVTNLLLQAKNRYESFDSSYVESGDKQKFIDNFKNKFNLENKDQWKDLKVIMNQKNKLDFIKSPFPEEQKRNSNSKESNTLNWFTNDKTRILPKIQDYK